jgi:hypothetical protein
MTMVSRPAIRMRTRIKMTMMKMMTECLNDTTDTQWCIENYSIFPHLTNLAQQFL